MNDPVVPALRFGLLGPLRVWRGETVVDLGPLQQRVVLAVLALQAGRPVSRQRMIDAVWGEKPPRNAVNLVQRHVSRLRRVLEPDRPGYVPSGMLAWTEAGYLLTLPTGALDLDIYESELNRARAARAAGHPREAVEALRSALQRWRGPVCNGLSSPFLDAQRDRLAESRISVVEERIELELSIGDYGDPIAELRDLVAEHPLRERLHGLLMLALYRAGRQADALAAFRDARRRLREELGIEPAAPLQRLHQQILAADPELLAAATAEVAADASATTGTRRPLPAQLPHRIPDFTGRDAELDRLDELLAGDRGSGTSVVVTAIIGTAGVGKTALAVHWAHRISERFPDGQLYVNLRGFDPTGSATKPAEAIRGFLDAFGVTPQQIPASLEAQAALYRSLLAGRRVLVLLDNAADEDQVRPLLPGSPGCLVILTSRNELPGLIVTDGAQPVLVDMMSTSEARQLLSRRIGESRVLAETQAAGDMIALCGRLPLALMLVAARAATHPQFSLSALAAELREAGGSLNAFDGEDQATNVRAVFSWSYRRLSPPGRRLFRLLGLHFGPDISLPAVASLAGMPRDQVRPVIAELARTHLVTERVPGRFALHDLLRAYATEVAYAHDTEDYRFAARHRMLDHYLHTACRAGSLLSRHRDRPFTMTDASPGVTPESPADQKQALTWFESEHAVLIAALRHSIGFDTHVWQLAWVLAASFFDFQGHWRDWRDSQRIALDASRRLSDKSAQAHSHVLLGSVSVRLSSYENARRHLQHAVELFRELGDDVGQADARNSLIFMLDQQDLYQEALPLAHEALALYQAAGHRTGQGRALNAVGWCHARLGDHEQALIYCQQALDLQREIGDQFGEAMTYDSLGYAHRHLGHREQATLCYQQSASLYGELGDLYNEADTLVSLGDARESFGDSKLARIAWQDALTIFEQLGLPRAETVRVRMREPGEPAGPIRAASHHYGDEVASDPPPVQRPRRRHMITKRMTGT